MRKSGYQNFDLEFHKTAGGHRVKARSFAGEATHNLVLPFTPAQAQAFGVDLEKGLAANAIPSERVKVWGGNLYEAIFANAVRAIYKSSLDLINAQSGSGLRIRLHLQDVAELSHLPWEFLYQAATNQDEPAQFILAGLVQNLNFFKEVYELGGVMKRSTVDSVAVKQNQLLDAENFKSHEAGDLEITASPNRFAIYDLMESGNALKVRAQGRLKSLQIGRGALQSELVPRYLSFIAHHPAVSVAMTWVGWFLTVVLPIFLQAKYGHKNDAN